MKKAAKQAGKGKTRAKASKKNEKKAKPVASQTEIVPDQVQNVPEPGKNVPDLCPLDELLLLLNPQQARFVEEYLIDLNGTKAAIRAGYSKHTAGKQVARLLAHVGIKKAIDAGKVEISKRLRINQDEVVKELAKIGFADMKAFAKWGPGFVTLKRSDELEPEQSCVVSELVETVTKDGGSIRFKLHDKVKALTAILDRVKPGADDPQKHEVNVNYMTLFPPKPKTMAEYEEIVKGMKK